MTTKYDLIEDLQKITTIPMTSLIKLEKKSIALLCDYIDSAISSDEKEVPVDIGIGCLTFLISKDEDGDDVITYRFAPSPELEKSIVNTFVDGVSPFAEMLGSEVCRQVLGMYKDLL